MLFANMLLFKKLTRLIVIALFMFLPITKLIAKTDNQLYQVELIAFAYPETNNGTSNAETFPLYPVLPDYPNSISLTSYDGTLALYQDLPRSMFMLNREANLIARKENYQVLYHHGWLQKAGSSKKVILKSSGGDDQGIAPNFSGTIKVRKGYYYIADINIALTQADNLNTPIVIKTRRKLKSKELHYIDHPKLGLLIGIYPKV